MRKHSKDNFSDGPFTKLKGSRVIKMKPHNNILYNINKLLNVPIADGMELQVP